MSVPFASKTNFDEAPGDELVGAVRATLAGPVAAGVIIPGQRENDLVSKVISGCAISA